MRITRPENDSEFFQKGEEKDMMSYMVLYGVSKNEAYLRFHPEYTDVVTKKIDRKGADESRQFFARQVNKDYIKAYKETLNKRMAGVRLHTEENSISEKRKDDALRSLFDKAMMLVEGRDELDADTLKIAAEIFKKIGLLKDEVEQTEAPRRYLPETCGNCEYKKFVEGHIKNGDIERVED